MHKIRFTISLFHASTCFEHHVLIVRRSKLYYRVSGIITPVGGRPGSALNLCTGPHSFDIFGWDKSIERVSIKRTALEHSYWLFDRGDDFFCVFLTVHLSIFILAINQLDAQNLFYNKFISCLYMFRGPCAHRQEVKIVLYSLWYHHTCRWPSGARDGHLQV